MHRALLHQLELLAPDHVRRLGPVHEHRADHEVDVREALLDVQRRRVARVRAPAEGDVELAQAVDAAVVDVDRRLHADRDEGRVHADHAAADDHHVRGRDAGHAAEQDPAPAERLLEHERARLRGDLARHLAHRREQREPAAGVLDGLVGDAGRAGVHEPLGQPGVGREVQVGEERVAGLEQRHLGRLRLLDLDDHVRRAEHGGRVGQDLRALGDVVGVGDGRALSGTGLDHDLVAVLDQLAHAGGRERDAVLVRLDLGGNADLHLVLSVVGLISSRPRRASQKSMRSRAESSDLPVSSSTRRMR